MEFAESAELMFKDNLSLKTNRKFRFALVFAIVFCVLLLITCIVLAVLYSQELNKSSTDETHSRELNKSSTDETHSRELNKSSTDETHSRELNKSSTDETHSRELNRSSTDGTHCNCSKNVEKYEICDDEQCFQLGQEMVKNMNKSVDPCEDFYAYACGGWQRRHPLENNETRTRILAVVHDKNIHVLKKALASAHVNYSKNHAVMKMVRVYKSCLNTAVIDALGLQPLKDLINQYGGWSISQNYDPNVTVAQRIGRAARDLNIDSLFGMDVTPNPYNSDVNVLMLKESALGLNKREYLDLDEDSEQKRKEYKNYMKVVSQIFKVPYTKMEAIYDFEVKLAKISSGKSPDAALKDYIRTIAKRTRTRRDTWDWTIKLSSLCQKTGFPWPVLKEVLDVLFERDLTGNEKIIPYSEDITFLKAISPLYDKTNHALLADYIMWQVVRQYVAVLPNQYRPSKQNDLLTSVNDLRWWQCFHALEKPFDMPLGLLYVDAHFNDDARVEIREMIENVQASFIQKLPTQTWMDKETQEMAKQKALAIAIADIGYPDYIKDPAKLKAQYDSLSVTDSLMDNIKAVNHFVRMRTLKQFEEPVDKKEWTKSPANVNSFYTFSRNRIVFLAGILQKPIYSPDYQRYINYGALGRIIGHEITHAFDANGRQYDKNGNDKNWWSDSSAANFESKSQCLIKQYNKYKIFDKHANGTKTLDENIADNNGIKLAYDAYQRWTKENGTEKILPGLDLNPNQLLFLSFAQSKCSVYSKDGAYNQLETDEHSTGKYRIIGSLSNFKKFSEVFKCPPNSGMNPVDKCEIW